MDIVELFTLHEPLLESIVRGLVVYGVILAMMRVLGQREAGGLGVTDLLVVVLVATAATPGLTGPDAGLMDGLVVVATILLLSVAVDALAYRFPRFSRIVKGRPKVLIRDGEVERHALRRELMSDEELATQLRLHGVDNASEVARALLEPNGMISVKRADAREPEEPERPPAM